MVWWMSSGVLTPMLIVRWAWASRSIRRTLCSASASAAPRLTAVVVLPTPPFWFAIEMVRAIRTRVYPMVSSGGSRRRLPYNTARCAGPDVPGDGGLAWRQPHPGGDLLRPLRADHAGQGFHADPQQRQAHAGAGDHPQQGDPVQPARGRADRPERLEEAPGPGQKGPAGEPRQRHRAEQPEELLRGFHPAPTEVVQGGAVRDASRPAHPAPGPLRVERPPEVDIL